MSITNFWTIEQLDVAPHENSLDNVVKVIHWRVTASDGTFSSGAYGTQALESPDPDAFATYNSLTEAQVKSWLFSALGDKAPQIENGLEKAISNQKDPQEITPSLPWG